VKSFNRLPWIAVVTDDELGSFELLDAFLASLPAATTIVAWQSEVTRRSRECRLNVMDPGHPLRAAELRHVDSLVVFGCRSGGHAATVIQRARRLHKPVDIRTPAIAGPEGAAPCVSHRR
jgi:hypothetical protein